MVYERFVTQFDGCAYHSAGENCTCACEAMWLYRASQGAIKTTACSVRVATRDDSGGTNLDQMQTVSVGKGITGGTLYRPTTTAKLQSLIQSGRYGAIIDIDYSPIAGTKYDCFDGQFRGGHAVYLSRGNATTAHGGDPGANGRRSTIPKGYQDYPWALLWRAAGLLDLGGGETVNSEYGAGHVFAYVTPADPAFPSATKYDVVIDGYVPLYAAPNGVRVGAVSRASYVCLKTKVSGLWWYKILTKLDGSATANRGRYFKPSRYTQVTLHDG